MGKSSRLDLSYAGRWNYHDLFQVLAKKWVWKIHYENCVLRKFNIHSFGWVQGALKKRDSRLGDNEYRKDPSQWELRWTEGAKTL